MTVFWIVAAALLVAALLFIVPPLLMRSSKEEVLGHDQANVVIYRDQLSELDNDLRNDLLAPDLYEQGRSELERRLLEDVSASASGAP